MSHSQKEQYDSELFDPDADANYANFLCIKENIRPETCTQMSSSQKVVYFQPSTSKSASTPAANAEQSLHPSKQTPTITDVLETLDAQRNIMRVLLHDVKRLRRELREERQNKNTGASDEISLETFEIPATSKDQFMHLENEIKDQLKRNILIKRFDKIIDQNLEKFVRACLKLIISDLAATHFSWFGRYDNVAVENFQIMNLIKECAIRKFPSCKNIEIVFIIKKWFQYAKDRVKKKNNKNIT